MNGTESQNGREDDPRVLLERYLEEGESCFPPLFRRIKHSLYNPVLKYRDFLLEGGIPDREAAARDGLSDLFAALCKQGAANRYEAARDCVYEIWALIERKRLLEKYRLDGRDGEGILNGLHAVAENHVYSLVTRKEPEMSRLFRRLKGLLEKEPEFEAFPDEKVEWWGLSGWRDPEQFIGSPEELRDRLTGVEAVCRVPERPGARKASTVISNRALKGLMVAIYQALLKTLTDSGLIRAVGMKVPIIDAGFVPLEPAAAEEGEEGEPAPVPPGAQAGPVQGWSAAAAEFLDSLSPRRRAVLKLYWLEGGTLVETGAKMGISKSLVKQEKDEILRLFRESAGVDSPEDLACLVAALRSAAVEIPADDAFLKGGRKR